MTRLKRFLLLMFLLFLAVPGITRATESQPASQSQETMASEDFYQAEGTADQFGQPSVDFTWLFLKTILAMVVVLALAVVGLRFILPRLSLNRMPKGGSSLTVLERMPLDAKKSLLILGVEERRLLIGVTDHQLSFLAELESNETQDLQ